MVKKLFILASAIATLAAMAAPAVASATPVLTSSDNPGVPIAKGKAVNATANDTSLRLYTETETFGELECANIFLIGEVTENSGTSIKGAGKTGSAATGCTIEGEIPITISEIEIVSLSSTEVVAETGTGEFSVKYTAKIPGGTECKFSNVGKTAGVFHYKLGTGILTITPTNVSNAGCGGSSLRGEVTLETGGGPSVLTSNGVKVPVGTAITGTANDTTRRLTTQTLFGELECESIMLNGAVTQNNGTTIEGLGAQGSTATGCTVEGYFPSTVNEIEIVSLSSTEIGAETGTGKFSAKYTGTLFGEATCKFNTNGVNGVFHYVLGTDVLEITPTKVSGGVCEAFLQGKVTLETTNGTPVTVGLPTSTPVTVS